jgi:hypothetical protein
MDGYKIIKVEDGVEEEYCQIPGSLPEVLAKLKAATGWTEPTKDGRFIIAGAFFVLRAGKILTTKSEIQQMFGVAEPTHVA